MPTLNAISKCVQQKDTNMSPLLSQYKDLCLQLFSARCSDHDDFAILAQMDDLYCAMETDDQDEADAFYCAQNVTGAHQEPTLPMAKLFADVFSNDTWTLAEAPS